jgi:cob(I)alamin adenosyltransferase
MSSREKEAKKVYTRTGDMGLTSLTTGERVLKSDTRVSLCGELDELNSFLGLAASLTSFPDLKDLLHQIQNEIMTIAGKLQTPSRASVDESRIVSIEKNIDTLTNETGSITYFILPGGSPAAAASHISRTICRRIERNLVALGEKEPVSSTILQYFNRLSDLLFVLARALNSRENTPDVRWQK